MKLIILASYIYDFVSKMYTKINQHLRFLTCVEKRELKLREMLKLKSVLGTS